MKRLLSLGVIVASALIAACGGSGNTITDADGGNNGGGGGTTTGAASIQLLASTNQILTDKNGNQAVTFTALVRDSSNVVVEGAAVSFTSSSGALAVASPLTDANGTATATLTSSGVANGSITVTASVTSSNCSPCSDSVTIQITGTVLTVSGPGALVQGQVGNYVASLRDGQGAGVSGQAVTVTSANGNTISSSNLTTDASGQVQFTVTATQPGADTVDVSALGLTTSKTVNVSDDSFSFTAPLPGAEIDLGAVANVSVLWEKGGVPQAGETINFTATRGTLSASSAVTDGAGVATVTISANTAGPAVISATNSETTTTTVSVEFLATAPDTLVLQADPFTVTTGQSSSVEAVVRDVNGNLVKNQTVIFELTDNTGGSLSVASDSTDSQGRARTTYTAGSSTSAQNGVQIRAFVQGLPAVEDTVFLTVAADDLFIVIGTGNDIFEPSSSLFATEWSVIATNVDGNPAANKNIQVSVLSNFYWKGRLVIDALNDVWVREPGAVQCADEDVNRNGILDAGEDFNTSGQIEAGNVATVTPAPANADCDAVAGPGAGTTTVTTNSAGIARVCVVYPQDHNLWVDVEIEAEASVAGTEFATSQQFLLPALASDLNNTSASPPGQVSPFGPDLDCGIPPP